MTERTILIRGSGDVGSAVAHRLFRAGFAVLLHDIPAPAVTRRGMAFADALFTGHAILAGSEARRVDTLADLPEALKQRRFLPVTALDFIDCCRTLPWSVLIDARMRKRSQSEVQRGLAILTVGLGPGFVAGETVDLAIETQWGEQLGALVRQGATRALAGEPRAIGGVGRERFVYAPRAGVLSTPYRIGERVAAGETIARLDGEPIRAPLTGTIRGLVHDGVVVTPRTKLLEIDPRGPDAVVFGLGERPTRIAEGVLRALYIDQTGV